MNAKQKLNFLQKLCCSDSAFPSVYTPLPWGECPLEYACSIGNKELIYKLIHKKASPNEWTIASPLCRSIMWSDAEVCAKLIDAGANLEDKAYWNNDPNIEVSHFYDPHKRKAVEILEFEDCMIENDLQRIDEENLRSPLNLALLFGEVAIVRLLLERGATISYRDFEVADDSDYNLAIENRRELIRLLLENSLKLITEKPIVDEGIPFGGLEKCAAQLLQYAWWDDELLQIYFRLGLKPTCLALLHILRYCDNVNEYSRAIKLLAFVDSPDEADRDENTILHYASQYSDPVAARAVLDAGVNANVRNKQGEAPLHWWARSASPSAVLLQLLIENRANIDLVSGSVIGKGLTPLGVATSGRYTLAMHMLRKAGATPV